MTHAVGQALGRGGERGHLVGVAEAGLTVDHEQRLAGRGLRLVALLDLGVEAVLRLLLLRDHQRGRVRQLAVLGARLEDRLFELHLGVGVLGDDVPTFAEVERKILNRHAVAEAKGELSALQASAQVDPGLLEIEAAQRSAEAQALLVQMRERLGLPAPVEDPAPASRRMIEQ